MVHRSDETPEENTRRNRSADILNIGWEQTVRDMRVMATDREQKGYETLTISSGNTAPISPGQGDDDRFGLSHLVDRRSGQDFLDLYDGRDFTETGVYQSVDSGHVFMVTEHIDYDNEIIIFIAGTFRIADAAAMVRTAIDRGTLYTYVRKLDRTILGTFEHGDVSAFFPDPEIYYSHDPSM